MISLFGIKDLQPHLYLDSTAIQTSLSQRFITAFKMFEINLKLFYISIQFLLLAAVSSCYQCQTPDSWLSGIAREQQQNTDFGDRSLLQNSNPKGKIWPNGVVKYKFHETLTLWDISEVRKAFEEFHTKTCIRFEPWREGDNNFVSIEVDDSICGKANVCLIGGYQFARFGGQCRTMAAMVHQLAHALCLGHEHQRMDRDDHVGFQNCTNVPNKAAQFHQGGIYDYLSQMHSQCGSCDGGFVVDSRVKCGPDVTRGLSNLDAEKINSIYSCKGTF